MEFETNNMEEDNAQLGLADPHFGLADILAASASASEAQPSSGSSISSASPPHDWGPNSWMDSGSTGNNMDNSAIDPILFDGMSTSGTGFDIPTIDLNSISELSNMNMGNITVDMFNNFQFMLPPSDLHKSPAASFPQQQTIVPNSLINGMATTAATNEAAGDEDDIVSAVKRLTGITNAQVAGAPSLFHDQYAIPAGFSDHTYSSASSDRSSVPPQTIEPSQSTTPSTPSVPSPATPSEPNLISNPLVQATSRPKTAHTTIERRYRTNLNTCIVGLRDSIPAVRYLDKAYKNPSGVPDVMDENGCLDGVKAARKISKATIMSKAREYIVVLKRRENRLNDELTSLKTLVSSLVGGPRLLDEWERQYAARVAASAVEEEIDTGEFDSDDENDEEDDEERPRKKAKLTNVPIPPPTKPKKAAKVVTPATPVEERPKKRGRPRKDASKPVQFAPISHALGTPTPVPIVSQQTASKGQGQGTTTYSFVPGLPQQQKRPALFLASFVFLSFFKPSTRTVVLHDETNNHLHVGQVLGKKAISAHAQGWSHEILHVLHTTIMVTLFAALVVSLSPQRWRNKAWRYLGHLLDLQPTLPSNDEEVDTAPPRERAERELKNSSSTPKSKLKIFNALQSTSSRTAEDYALLALLRFPTKASQALELWKEGSLLSPNSSLGAAFDLPLPQAVELLSNSSSDSRSPLVILASKAVENRLERVLKETFIDEVVAICESDSHVVPAISVAQREDLIAQCLQIGGKPAEVVEHWDAALTGHFKEADSPIKADDLLFNLLKVLSHIRRIFPTTSRTNGLPSPPPSPLSQEELVKAERELRVSVGALHGGDVERARDLLIGRLMANARIRRAKMLEGLED